MKIRIFNCSPSSLSLSPGHCFPFAYASWKVDSILLVGILDSVRDSGLLPFSRGLVNTDFTCLDL